MDQTENRYPEILAVLVDKLTEQLQDEGLMAHQARTIAWNVAEKIRKDWGGLDIYIPKGISYDVDQRDLEIYEQFTGSNHTDLARRHGLSGGIFGSGNLWVRLDIRIFATKFEPLNKPKRKHLSKKSPFQRQKNPNLIFRVGAFL